MNIYRSGIKTVENGPFFLLKLVGGGCKKRKTVVDTS